MLGEGLDHMWSEYEQIPTSPFWEKLKNRFFTIRIAPETKYFIIGLAEEKIKKKNSQIFSDHGS